MFLGNLQRIGAGAGVTLRQACLRDKFIDEGERMA